MKREGGRSEGGRKKEKQKEKEEEEETKPEGEGGKVEREGE